MTNSPFRPVLRSQSDVHAMWRTIIHPLGWHSRRLYAVVVDDGDRPLPVVHEVDELPPRLSRDDATAAVRLVPAVPPGHRVALLYCRPGAGAALTRDDRTAARLLYDAARRLRVALEVVHVATDTAIVPAPLDAVVALVS